MNRIGWGNTDRKNLNEQKPWSDVVTRSWWGTVMIVGLSVMLGLPHGLEAKKPEELIVVPVASLDVNEATATVSVLPDNPSPISTIFDWCQAGFPEDTDSEIQEISEELKKWCRMAEGFTKKYVPPPAQHFQAQGYVITVPVKHATRGVEAVLWNTKTLDDAIVFVDLLQSGKLKAVNVYASVPWQSQTEGPCSHCPIKELVFHASGIREQLKHLQKP